MSDGPSPSSVSTPRILRQWTMQTQGKVLRSLTGSWLQNIKLQPMFVYSSMSPTCLRWHISQAINRRSLWKHDATWIWGFRQFVNNAGNASFDWKRMKSRYFMFFVCALLPTAATWQCYGVAQQRRRPPECRSQWATLYCCPREHLLCMYCLEVKVR